MIGGEVAAREAAELRYRSLPGAESQVLCFVATQRSWPLKTGRGFYLSTAKGTDFFRGSRAREGVPTAAATKS